MNMKKNRKRMRMKKEDRKEKDRINQGREQKKYIRCGYDIKKWMQVWRTVQVQEPRKRRRGENRQGRERRRNIQKWKGNQKR